ncbi:hypothetical protein F3Y22_tig00112231pilonHSYRG00008 [Hibiscus syriacus]|uniref:Protein kinase domain-containing protein n=1 Tax=Hibiscus syriacus TaxID=106335 RepID=A0A6A2YB12_HIBSY|nr:hypothetical protein F3Y22_tig00112231pilonHSYRG00008 [Hibiscus syriacus]
MHDPLECEAILNSMPQNYNIIFVVSVIIIPSGVPSNFDLKYLMVSFLIPPLILPYFMAISIISLAITKSEKFPNVIATRLFSRLDMKFCTFTADEVFSFTVDESPCSPGRISETSLNQLLGPSNAYSDAGCLINISERSLVVISRGNILKMFFHGLSVFMVWVRNSPKGDYKNANLEDLGELGSSTYGTVYHGKWWGTDVAIKRIKKSCFSGRSSEKDRQIQDFWIEAQILSNLHHPNVVVFYGVVPDGSGGTLATGPTTTHIQGTQSVKDKHRYYGHYDFKIRDFRLSKIKLITLVSGGVRGTLPWMALELLNGSSTKVSEKVDVFSYGISMWEILTGEEPYVDMHYGAIIGKILIYQYANIPGIVKNTLRPPIPECYHPD